MAGEFISRKEQYASEAPVELRWEYVKEVVRDMEKLAVLRFGKPFDRLQMHEGQIAVNEARAIVGPFDEFMDDFVKWRETANLGEHMLDFDPWRMQTRETYRLAKEKLKRELEDSGLH